MRTRNSLLHKASKALCSRLFIIWENNQMLKKLRFYLDAKAINERGMALDWNLKKKKRDSN